MATALVPSNQCRVRKPGKIYRWSGSIDIDSMDADIPPLTTERHAENKAFFDAIEKATLRQGELKEGFSRTGFRGWFDGSRCPWRRCDF